MRGCYTFLVTISIIRGVISNEAKSSSIQGYKGNVWAHKPLRQNAERRVVGLDSFHSKVKQYDTTRYNVAPNEQDSCSSSFEIIEMAYEFSQVEPECNLNTRQGNFDYSIQGNGIFFKEHQGKKHNESKNMSDAGAPLEFNISNENEPQSVNCGHDECGIACRRILRNANPRLSLCEKCEQYELEKLKIENSLRAFVKHCAMVVCKYEGDFCAKAAIKALQRHLDAHNVEINVVDPDFENFFSKNKPRKYSVVKN